MAKDEWFVTSVGRTGPSGKLRLCFSVPMHARGKGVIITLYSIKGEQVRTLEPKPLSKENAAMAIEVPAPGTGRYLVRLQSAGRECVVPLLVLRN
jgi:hypothetical protein